jgi:hypothetical protein|tara:strand:+ start:497 stop:685 length:189 start_codon:yes stop_codon:yes gene_type:complete
MCPLKFAKNHFNTNFNFTGKQSSRKHKKEIDVDFIAGEFLQCYLNGNSINYPKVLIEIAWGK